MRGLSLFASVLLLTACASAPPAPSADLPPLRLAPAALGQELQLAQRLTVEIEGTQRTLDALLEIDAQLLRLAALVAGQRVLTLGWDGRQLQVEKLAGVPELISAERVLRDLQLAYWPAAPLREALPRGWSLDDETGLRVLRQGNEAVVEIRYAGSPRWHGLTDFRNLRQRYRLLIDSVPAG